jgi:tetratricopeptide (TPR) repeat protein
MSILSALKTQQGSIRELAALPQQQILKMAQMGQLDVSMVPVILNEKAQMVQQVANMQAMAQQMPPTEIEQAMAINAQAEVPQQPAGIESLPQGAEMFNETSLAGGGIVAFEDGGAVPRYQGQGIVALPRFEDLPRVGRDAVVPGSGISSFFKGMFETQDLRVDPVTGEPVSFGEYMRRLDQRRAQANMPTSKAIASLSPGEMPPDVASGEYADRKLREAGVKYTDPAQMPADVASGEYADRKLREAGVQYTTGAPKAAAPAVKPKTIQDYLAEAKAEGPQGEAYSELEKEIRGSAGQKKAEREQNMWMRIAEAGFGIMSGESPYAMTNLGKGMSSAMKSYAEDLREQKKLDREDRRTLADIEQARRAEQKGQYDKAVDRYEKALNRMSEDERARLLRETQEKVAKINASQRPSPFQEYLSNPEKYAEFSKVVRPGFESAETQRDKTALDQINGILTFMKKDDPQRKQYETARDRIMSKLMGQIPSFSGALNPPADIKSIVAQYAGK